MPDALAPLPSTLPVSQYSARVNAGGRGADSQFLPGLAPLAHVQARAPRKPEVPTMATRRTRRLVPPTPLLTLAIATATALAAALAAPSPATAQTLPTIEAHTEGTTAMEGFFNLYWDDAAGSLYWGDRRAGHRVSLPDLDGVGAREQSGGDRPGAVARDARLRGAAHRAAGAARRAQLRVPGHHRQHRRGAGRARCLRAVGALGVRHRGAHRRPRAGGRHRSSSCATRAG